MEPIELKKPDYVGTIVAVVGTALMLFILACIISFYSSKTYEKWHVQEIWKRDDLWRDIAVEHGAAEYDDETGRFRWKDSPVEKEKP